MKNLEFREIWLVDFEYTTIAGELPQPICLVALELRSGREERIRGSALLGLAEPPYPLDDQTLFVTFAGIAELCCHISLKWTLPCAILDLHAEFRLLTNGRVDAKCCSLLAACQMYGIPSVDAGIREQLRNLATRGEIYTDQESCLLEECCASDVKVLATLLLKMESEIDMARALIRGRYLRALAQVEARGLPIDVEALTRFRQYWPEVRSALIAEFKAAAGIYRDGSFCSAQFEHWLREKGIHWPRLESGRLKLDDDTFKSMAFVDNEIAQLRELRKTLATMREFNVVVGRDGRSRPPLMPWQSRTGRNQPSTSEFLFGLPGWMRGFLRPTPGRALSYIDWSQQEFGIAAVLAADGNMVEAYSSGDPYLAFAKQAMAVPADATKESHPHERECFKACTLAVQYGMGAESLAVRIGQSPAHAAALLRQHRSTYRDFWAWSERVLNDALLKRKVTASYGWAIHLSSSMNKRSICNFPMQANGSEMMRLACFLAVEAGVEVCATVHDAFLIESSVEGIEQAELQMRRSMEEASRLVLGGFSLRSDVRRITYSSRFDELKGSAMWQRVHDILQGSMSHAHPKL